MSKISRYIPKKLQNGTWEQMTTSNHPYKSTVLHPYTGKPASFSICPDKDGKYYAVGTPWTFKYIKTFVDKYGLGPENWWMFHQHIIDSEEA